MSDSSAGRPSERFSLRTLPGGAADLAFGPHVRQGLRARAKALSPVFFYDALGSKLFEAICRLEEYYPTRAEREILTNHTDAILAHVPGDLRLIELGSGSAEKSELLIAAVLRRQRELTYLPLDVSDPALRESAERMLEHHPGLRVSALCGTYAAGLAAAPPAPPGVASLALFLGSSIGNLDHAESVALLRHVRRAVGPGGALLLGADLRKSPARLVAAYDDPAGVTAAFNLNLLGRINRELGGHFDLRAFAHVALYDETSGRIEMHLESRRAQSVRIDALDLEVAFAAGERIHTENSYKYDRAYLEVLAADTGWRLAELWTDREGLFSSSLLRA